MARLELDFVFDPKNVGERLDQYEAVELYGLEMEIVSEVGPGGGNPLCAVIGMPHDIVKFLEESGYCDPEDVAMLTDRITF